MKGAAVFEITDTTRAARHSRNPKKKLYGAQPPGSPLCAGFAHNGVEVPSAATDESQVQKLAPTPKLQINLKGRLVAALYYIKVTIPIRI